MAIEHDDLPVTIESIHMLQSEIVKIRQNFAISRLELENLKTELDNMTAKFLGSLSRERDLNQQVSELSAQVSALREKLLQLQGSPDTSKVLESLKTEFDQLQKDYKECQNRNKDLDKSLSHLLPPTPSRVVVDRAMGTYGKPLNRAASIALKKLLP